MYVHDRSYMNLTDNLKRAEAGYPMIIGGNGRSPGIFKRVGEDCQPIGGNREPVSGALKRQDDASEVVYCDGPVPEIAERNEDGYPLVVGSGEHVPGIFKRAEGGYPAIVGGERAPGILERAEDSYPLVVGSGEHVPGIY